MCGLVDSGHALEAEGALGCDAEVIWRTLITTHGQRPPRQDPTTRIVLKLLSHFWV